jgi:hypothetical protein
MYGGPQTSGRAVLVVTGSVLPTREASQHRARHEVSQEGKAALRNSQPLTTFHACGSPYGGTAMTARPYRFTAPVPRDPVLHELAPLRISDQIVTQQRSVGWHDGVWRALDLSLA